MNSARTTPAPKCPTRSGSPRSADVRGFWSYFLALDLTMSTSMLHELIEWAAAEVFGGDLGVTYLGTQGDVWDAHKDMLLDRLHFTFTVEDGDIGVTKKWSGESTLDGEDRVEVFFANDSALKGYWCLKIDSRGRGHDYHAQHYRKFDSV